MKKKSQLTSRSKEITSQYFRFLDQHINDVADGRILEFMELNQIASELAISHQHLTDTIKKETGENPCHFYDEKIILKAKELLKNKNISIAKVSLSLTYDPSNFSKFFKKWTGITPGEFRKKV
ncbi:AraC family transcriptional regulator [Epilithonimonas sp.]|uniref:helix-turn-helix domain-containing protein n=1 Tax=Epilithonimonas sp. TaxID=2894511 RepID=UPI0028A0BC32|nr:AraC family transcriptional regulator [Epilithonimonas sp.]